MRPWLSTLSAFFFFNDTATTEIYTLSLHDALPIWSEAVFGARDTGFEVFQAGNVLRFFELARVHAEVTVRCLENAFQVIEAETCIGRERTHNAQPDALMNQPVEFGQVQSAGGHVLACGNHGFRGLAALRQSSSHRTSEQSAIQK